MAVLKFKDDLGAWHNIPAIQGESAYDQAVTGGYSGTLQNFYDDLARLDNMPPYTWAEFQQAVRNGTITRYFAVGDQFNVTKGAINLVFDIVDIGNSTRNVTANGNAPTDANYFTNFPNAKPVTLLMHDVINSVIFDMPEANYKITTQINSGATCVISLGYGTTPTSDFRFTASKNLVVGGKIQYKSPTQFNYFATATAAAEVMSMAAGEEGDGYTSVAGSLSVQNNLYRVQYGSNKYSESAIRQFLNAGGAAGAYWTSKSDYDLAPSWHSTLAGFQNGLDADLLAVIGQTTREVELNTITDGGGNTTITDKIFLPSEKEIYGSAENVTHKGVEFQGYVPLADIDKIKYDAAAPSTARLWWLRSPIAGSSSSARYVGGTTGALTSGGAGYTGIGAVAACVIL